MSANFNSFGDLPVLSAELTQLAINGLHVTAASLRIFVGISPPVFFELFNYIINL